LIDGEFWDQTRKSVKNFSKVSSEVVLVLIKELYVLGGSLRIRFFYWCWCL